MDSHDMRCLASPVIMRTLRGVLALVLLFLPATGYTGQWRVAPARVFLERSAKSSVITVVNEGEEKVHLQGKAVEWIQDENGKDVLLDTDELLFSPRIVVLNKGEQRIIRAGIKSPATAKEKTYRLFIEEIPQPKQGAADSAQLTVAVRFGIPVFVRPLKEEPRGEVTAASLSKGVVAATVKNTGNVHFRIRDIAVVGRNAKGEETFSVKLDGWYLLAGASRVYSTPIPRDKCVVTERVEVTVATDTKISLNRLLNVEKAQCLP